LGDNLDPDSSELLSYLLSIFSNHWMFFLSNGVVVFILLLLSAVISGSEVAFFSLSFDRLKNVSKKDKLGIKRIKRLLSMPKRLLATILILNNFVNIAIVTLATFMMWKIVGGVDNAQSSALVVLTLSVTFIIVFFGEIVPKVYANNKSYQFAIRMAGILFVAEKLLRPFSSLLLRLSNIVEKRIQRKGFQITVDELSHALEITDDKGATEEEKEILKGIVNFSSISSKQIMRSRIDITAFDITIDFHDLMDKINKSGYSRVPVFEETIDNIKGIIYIKDLLPYIDQDENFGWQKLLRDPYFVPEAKKIDDLLKAFQLKRVHMAIVIDEYGGTSGLLTLEDILEEIVGEINDEFDNDDVVYQQLDEQTYIFEGKTSLLDFCRVVNAEESTFDEVKGESESIGGLLLEIHSAIPNAGDVIHYKNYDFKIESSNNKRIKRIRIHINPAQKKHETD